MQSPHETKAGYSLQPRLRVFAGEQMVLGWGKILLLQHVQETGSISEAAQRLGMSYNHAWTLLRVMNQSFREPLVVTNRGGKARGGASLTEAGLRVVEIYGAMIEESTRATQASWNELQALLRPEEDIPGERESLP